MELDSLVGKVWTSAEGWNFHFCKRYGQTLSWILSIVLAGEYRTILFIPTKSFYTFSNPNLTVTFF